MARLRMGRLAVSEACRGRWPRLRPARPPSFCDDARRRARWRSRPARIDSAKMPRSPPIRRSKQERKHRGVTPKWARHHLHMAGLPFAPSGACSLAGRRAISTAPFIHSSATARCWSNQSFPHGATAPGAPLGADPPLKAEKGISPSLSRRMTSINAARSPSPRSAAVAEPVRP